MPYAVFVGEDEIKDGVLTVKDLATGEQTRLSPEDAVKTISAALEVKNSVKVIKEPEITA